MRSAFIIALLVACAAFMAAQDRATTIILVRHAEKDTMKVDPPLTKRGRERAALLARIVAAAGVSSTHSTQYRRTVETVAPADSAFGLRNEVVEADPDSLPAHVSRLIDHLLTSHTGQTTLVASHSNVIPMILTALGLGKVAIGDKEYDDLFVIHLNPGCGPTLTRLAMGTP